ncbi:hypothetical protein AK812_SmicGene47367, partial [Symbiodinium microadriaticum]
EMVEWDETEAPEEENQDEDEDRHDEWDEDEKGSCDWVEEEQWSEEHEDPEEEWLEDEQKDYGKIKNEGEHGAQELPAFPEDGWPEDAFESEVFYESGDDLPKDKTQKAKDDKDNEGPKNPK